VLYNGHTLTNVTRKEIFILTRSTAWRCNVTSTRVNKVSICKKSSYLHPYQLQCLLVKDEQIYRLFREGQTTFVLHYKMWVTFKCSARSSLLKTHKKMQRTGQQFRRARYPLRHCLEADHVFNKATVTSNLNEVDVCRHTWTEAVFSYSLQQASSAMFVHVYRNLGRKLNTSSLFFLYLEHRKYYLKKKKCLAMIYDF